MMTLWCIMRSPLMIGAEMTKNDDFTLGLLTNREVLGMEKDSFCAHPLWTTAEESVWVAPAKEDGGLYCALFNLSDEERLITVSAAQLERPLGAAKELWSGEAATGKAGMLRTTLKPHDAAVYKIEG